MIQPKYKLNQLVDYDGMDYRVVGIYSKESGKVLEQDSTYIYLLEREDMPELFNMSFEFELTAL